MTHKDSSQAQLVAHHKRLVDVQRGFSFLKSDMEIEPVQNRLSQRIRAHAMVCFVALVVCRVMRMRQKAS